MKKMPSSSSPQALEHLRKYVNELVYELLTNHLELEPYEETLQSFCQDARIDYLELRSNLNDFLDFFEKASEDIFISPIEHKSIEILAKRALLTEETIQKIIVYINVGLKKEAEEKATAIRVPQYHPTLKRVRLKRWFKSNGQFILKGDLVCEVTFHNLNEFVKAPVSGKVAQKAPENFEVPIGELLCEIEHDKPSGRNTYRWSNGNLFEGEWREGEITGKGKLLYHNRDAYEGDFLEGLPSGKGVLRLHIGEQYEGKFWKGKFHGQGIYLWNNGDRYEGNFREGQRAGRGLYQLQGNFHRIHQEDFHQEGQAIFKFSNGDRAWVEYLDKQKIQEQYLFQNGDVYVGSFYNGQFSGDGDLIKASTHGKLLTLSLNELYGRVDKEVTYEYRYVGTFQNGQFHGSGSLEFANGDFYDGGFAQGDFHGEGKLTFGNAKTEEDRAEYAGGFKHGVFHGFGTLFYKDGRNYRGEFYEGKPHGLGTYQYAGLHDEYKSYEGSFKTGQFHGKGKLTYLSEDWYDGDFEEGQRHGIGQYFSQEENMIAQRYYFKDFQVIKQIVRFKQGDGNEGQVSYADGSRYEGELLNYNAHGHGREVLNEEEFCEGQFREGSFVKGNARIMMKDGAVFEGETEPQLGRQDGVVTRKSGEIYKGRLEDFLFHGRGRLDNPNGEYLDGSFFRNVFQSGRVKMTLQDGSLYEGDFHISDLMHGQGQLYLENGDHYQGSFKKGKFHGRGTYIYQNGDVYEGDFIQGRFQGEGTLSELSGKCIYEGFWERGKRQGEGTQLTEDGQTLTGLWQEDQLIKRYRQGGFFKRWFG